MLINDKCWDPLENKMAHLKSGFVAVNKFKHKVKPHNSSLFLSAEMYVNIFSYLHHVDKGVNVQRVKLDLCCPIVLYTDNTTSN